MKPNLYLFDDIEAFSEEHLAAALSAVSGERRKKTLAYVPVLNRKLSVIAELLLRYGWRDLYDRRQTQGLNPGSTENPVPDFPKIETEPGGKPYFLDEPTIHFNLSHCKVAVACALADRPVGVDVESYRDCHESLLKKVLNEEEQKQAENNQPRFAELWTMKESYVKYTGQGLTDDLPDLLNRARAQNTVFKTFRFEPFDRPDRPNCPDRSDTPQKGYACTICCGGAGSPEEPDPLQDVTPVCLTLEELIDSTLPKKSYLRL